MRKLGFLFLLLSFHLNAQRVFLKGKVLDSNTQEPVVYANISFLSSTDGISTLENGSYYLSVLKKNLKSKVHISCLNYKDTIVNATDLIDATIFMQPKIEVLQEVVISNTKQKQVELDPVKGSIISMHSKGMRMVAKYFPNTKKNKCCSYLSKVTIEFPRRVNKKSKFRFRIFSVEKNSGKPLEDLLLKNIPVTITENQKQVELDISNQYLEMPKEGFFVAFEKLFIPYNKYGAKNEFGDDDKGFYSPIIGVTKSRFYKRDVSRNYIYTNGKWLELPFTKRGRLRGYVPAISVTLTN